MSNRRYRLRPSNTFAAIIVHNDDGKLLSRLGHDHVVRATDFTSTVAIDPDHPEKLGFSLNFPVRSLVVDDADDRARVDLDGTVSERDQKMTRNNMLADGQLDADRHETIKFRVTGARPEPSGLWVLDTNMSVRGHRFEFEFPVSVDLSPRLLVSGRIDIGHSDLGLKPYRAPMGTLRNREKLTLVVDIDAVPL